MAPLSFDFSRVGIDILHPLLDPSALVVHPQAKPIQRTNRKAHVIGVPVASLLVPLAMLANICSNVQPQL